MIKQRLHGHPSAREARRAVHDIRIAVTMGFSCTSGLNLTHDLVNGHRLTAAVCQLVARLVDILQNLLAALMCNAPSHNADQFFLLTDCKSIDGIQNFGEGCDSHSAHLNLPAAL